MLVSVKSLPLFSIVQYKETKWYIQRRKVNVSILVSVDNYKEIPNDTEVKLISTLEETAKHFLKTNK